MSEPEVVFDGSSVTVWHQPGSHPAAETWIILNGLYRVRLTMRGFLHRRGAAAFHVVSKQDHWYRGRDMAEAIRCINALTPATCPRVVLTGASMGGFGALLHSSDLRCDLVVVSGPQVVVDDQLSVGHDDRYRSEWKALETPAWLPWHDASERCTRAVPIRLIYDPHASEDRWHAAFLRRLPNVTLWRAPFAGHDTLLELQRAEIWTAALEAVLADDRPAWLALMRSFAARRHQRFPYHWALGLRHFQRGRFDHSARHFRHAIEIEPKSRESYGWLARALRDGGSLPHAIAALESAIPHLEDDPRYWWIYQRIANLHIEAGQFGMAADALLLGKAMFPSSPELEAEQAKLRLVAARTPGDFSAAGKLAARAFAMDPASRHRARLLVHVQGLRARHLIEKGRARALAARLGKARGPEARCLTEAAIALIQGDGADAEDFQVLLGMADMHEAVGDTPAAIAALRAAADRAEPGRDDWMILHRLTALHAKADDIAAAEAALVQAADRFPGVAAVQFELGKFRLERPGPNPAAAARSLRRALAIAPDYAQGPALLARADQMRAKRLEAAGRPNAAALVHRLLVAADPRDISRHVDLADALEAAGRLADAATTWRAAAALVAQDASGWWPYHRIAAMWARRGNLVEAEAAIAEAADRFPDRTETVTELGKFMLEKRVPDYPEAARLLRRAVALAPRDDRPRALLRRCRETARKAGEPLTVIDRVRFRLFG